jgi:transcriptional antiterminator RfaH
MSAARQRWYAVHSQARAEFKAAGHLLRQGFAVYLPRYLRRRFHARKVDWVPAPLFPRYLFVGLDLAAARWRAIQSTVGVSHLVCNAGRPAPLPDAIVAELRQREDDRGFVRMAAEPPFAPGQALRITGGALCDQIGLFDGLTDDERVVVLLDLLGRQVRAELPLQAVRASA